MSFAERRRAFFNPGALILLYHRIANPAVDPFALSVSPENFEAHLEILRRRARVVPLRELLEQLERGRIERGTVVITFDDGYADNLHVAAPRLARHGMPATVFVTSHALDEPRGFWWDRLAAVLFRAPQIEGCLNITIDGNDIAIDAGRAGDTEPANRNWRAWETPPTQRHAAFAHLWRRLQMVSTDERGRVIAQLEERTGITDSDDADRTMTSDELRALQRSGSIEIGAHTMTHPRLSVLPVTEQRTELVGSKARLEGILGTSVTSMSYPFGGRDDYSADTVSLAQQAGFRNACATERALARPGVDQFQLPRQFVPDLTGPAFAGGLRTWLAGE